MAIFPYIEHEDLVQVNDRTRLNSSKSYVTPDEAAITKIEVQPESSASFFDITSNKYLDYQYSSDGDKTVTVRVTTDGTPVTVSSTISVVTEADDKLFSKDADLTSHESEILKYVDKGRNSFKNVHRRAQSIILAYLDEHRIWDKDGNRLTKDDIVDIQEVTEWSKFTTLRLIFEDRSNGVDDLFQNKASLYEAYEQRARNRGTLRLDTNNDGVINNNDNKVDLQTIPMVRR